MRLQMARQVIDAHVVDTRRTLVALHLPQGLLEVLTLDYVFHRRPTDRRAFEVGFRRVRFGLSGGGAQGFTLRSGSQGQVLLILLPHGVCEIALLLASSIVRAFVRLKPPYYALC